MNKKIKAQGLDETHLRNWEALNDSDNPVRRKIISDWKNLLSTDRIEETYQNFLAEHAGFFFYETILDSVVIAKMKFGADFVSDFVVCYDRGSDGFQYELIELEKPSCPIFTKHGHIASRLNSAIHQVQSWKMWLLKHTGSLPHLFPSNRYDIDGFLNMKYTIIIGQSDLLEDYQIKKRILLSESLGISIRSYEYFTKKLVKSVFPNKVHFYNDHDNHAEAFASDFANPFYKAYTDKQWRDMIKTKGFRKHDMITDNIENLLKYRSYNTHRLKQFEEAQRARIVIK